MSIKDSPGMVSAAVAGDATNHLSFHNVKPVHINVRGLSVRAIQRNWWGAPKKTTATKNKKQQNDDDVEKQAAAAGANSVKEADVILNDISLDAPSGTLTAIIGGSGSGKTSLLNAMSNRVSSSGMKQTGSIYCNGIDGGIKYVSYAYVLQQDILEPNLTCRETLKYAADLRLPDSTNKLERDKLVEELILELGLKECADTMVGNTQHRGLSGGEKRRLSIGIQLLSNPSVLFLDEPTTGLDANSAYLVIKTCRQLAENGRTLVLSIHQPRSDIFFLFHRVTLLSKGQMVYTGDVAETIPYFENLGFKMPKFTNPADFIIDLSVVDNRTPKTETKTLQRLEYLITSWKTQPLTAIYIESSTDASAPHIQSNNRNGITKAPLPREILVLAKRSFIVSYRDPMGYIGLFIEALLMGLICGWIFYKPGTDLSGIRSLQGALYVSCSMQGYFLLLYETYRLCGPDLKVFDREHSEGCVSPAGYLIARRLSKVLTEDLFVPLVYSVVMYFMVGLRNDDGGAKHFFTYFAVVLLQHYNSITFATLAASISRDFSTASLISNLCYTLQSMACGFFVNVKYMRVYVRWTRYIAFLYYALGAMLSNQFTNFVGDCPYDSEEQCVSYIGKYILKNYGFSENWIWKPIIILLFWSVGFYLAAWFFLRFTTVSVKMSTRKVSDNEAEDTKENAEDGGVVYDDTQQEQSTTSTPVHPGIAVTVEDIYMKIVKRQLNGKTFSKNILNGITGTFSPGCINAILGPSGSGKSTLLNFIADRLHSNVFQKYVSEKGRILFDNMEPSAKLVSSLCSYVTQEDDGLLPSLTVRETLFFAACLRLPQHLSKNQKRARAEEVLRKMGLKDCADTIIGNDLHKGISGGEKRRVTISIQLLSDPKILLLDEPTSGLDSFTASSILEALDALSKEGRTVIATIHQPRSDLYKAFGNVLLLAKGGRVAYDGKAAAMVDYFTKLGYPCPELTNPADFVLDIISVNLQSLENETKTRERVEFLLESWQSHKAVFDSQKNSSLVMSESHDEAVLNSFAKFSRSSANFWVAYPILLKRNAINFLRSPEIIIARVMQIIGMGGILALFFTPVGSGYIFVTNVIGLVQELSSVYFVGMLNNMAAYPMDRSVFYGENDDNVYGVVPFMMTYLTLELPSEIFSSLVFSVFLVMIPGLPRTAGMFFGVFYGSIALISCGESLGIIFNTLFLHEGFALTLISVVLSLGCIMGGLLSLNMDGFLKAINWLSPIKYALAIVNALAFNGQKISCKGQSVMSDGSCAFDTGEKVLKTYHMPTNIKGYCGGLAGAIILYRALAILVVYLARLKFKVRK